jgi:hypothetical protein
MGCLGPKRANRLPTQRFPRRVVPSSMVSGTERFWSWSNLRGEFVADCPRHTLQILRGAVGHCLRGGPRGGRSDGGSHHAASSSSRDCRPQRQSDCVEQVQPDRRLQQTLRWGEVLEMTRRTARPIAGEAIDISARPTTTSGHTIFDSRNRRSPNDFHKDWLTSRRCILSG